MQNKEGIFSYPELNQLKDFCNECAKEDRRIYEQRKKNSSYMPEDKKPQPIKNSNPPSYQVSNQSYNNNNYYGQNKGGYQVQNNYQGNAKSKNTNNNYNNNNNNMKFSNSMMNGDTFDKRLKMFGK